MDKETFFQRYALLNTEPNMLLNPADVFVIPLDQLSQDEHEAIIETGEELKCIDIAERFGKSLLSVMDEIVN